MRRYILIVGVILFFGCDSTTSLGDENPEFSLKFEQSDIDSIEELKADFKIFNSTLKEQTFSFTSGCQSGFKIEKEGGETIFDLQNFVGCTGAISQFTLKRGESKIFAIDLHHTRTYAGETLDDVEPGIYKLSAFLLNEQSPEVSQIFNIQ